MERARPDAVGLAAGEADQAAVGEAGPVPWQHRAGWFEQPQPDPAPATTAPAAGGRPQPGTLVQAPPRPPRAWLLGAFAVTLAVGLVLGMVVGSVRAGGEPTRVPARRVPAAQPAQAAPTSVVVVARPTASPACLETARRGDQLIELLIRNQRSRAADLLVAYTVASRQCHKDASP